MLSLTALQFKRRPEQGGAAAEGVVVGVGVDAVEEGVGVVALVQEVGEFQTEDALLPLVLRGGVEEGHALVLIGGDLAAHVVVVQGEVEGGDGEYVDGSAVGEGGRNVALLGVAGARPAVADVVAQFEPLDGGDGGIAVEVVAVGANLDDVRSPFLGGDGLLAVAKTVVGICAELGEDRGEVLRAADGEAGGAAAGVALQGRAADVDAADALRVERVALALAMRSGEAQREVLHGQLPLPFARRVPRVRLADDARRGAHRAVVHLHRLRQQRHHIAYLRRVARRELQFAVSRESVVDAHRGIEYGLRIVQFIVVQPLQGSTQSGTQIEAAVARMNLEAGIDAGRE